MKRRKEREFALQVLYALEYNSIPYMELISLVDEDRRKFATEFAIRLIEISSQQRDNLDEQITSCLINWDFNRVAIIDRILLRMAMSEFVHFNDIPPEVTLNEMIEISKMYSTERSGKFINGVLDAILKKLRAENKLKKLGRGLVSKLK